jgi:uncharacterized DUF497 family protein
MHQRDDFIWIPDIVDKIWNKHRVEPEEVEQVFENRPRIFRGPKGHYAGEDIYYALGQTDEGRYLFVVYIKKQQGQALILSARDMTAKERQRFGRK